MNYPSLCTLFLLPAILILMELGRRLRIHRKVEFTNSTVEGAVLALFGLLLAFTFSGAMTRYDAHRSLIVEETNDIGTAYLRLDLLPPAAQPALRKLFRDYTTSRLHLYDSVAPEISPETVRLQREIWQESVRASTAPEAASDAAKLLLPAINSMIDITATRQNSFNMHPPVIVYWLLFAFSCGCAFMAGYGMSALNPNWFYAIALALAVTLTIYATLEIEYPRRGFIRLVQTDQNLVHLRDSMN